MLQLSALFMACDSDENLTLLLGKKLYHVSV